MRRSIVHVFTALGAALCAVLAPSAASAGIDACNNINISAEAECEVIVSGGCVAQCEPVSFQAACAAELYVECAGKCEGSATLDCQPSCEATCDVECKADPGSFECSAGCEANCSSRCDGHCSLSANKGECRASCEATCAGECDAQCKGTPPEASCDAKCEAGCSGSCSAQANFDCQLKCQTEGSAGCRAELQGGCEAQCSKPEGALFCDGQYVDARDQLNECLAYLEGVLQIDVRGYASADAACSGNACRAEGEAGFECAASPTGVRSTPANTGALMLAAVGTGLLLARRRRPEKR